MAEVQHAQGKPLVAEGLFRSALALYERHAAYLWPVDRRDWRAVRTLGAAARRLSPPPPPPTRPQALLAYGKLLGEWDKREPEGSRRAAEAAATALVAPGGALLGSLDLPCARGVDDERAQWPSPLVWVPRHTLRVPAVPQAAAR